jgi:hypothetical protein
MFVTFVSLLIIASAVLLGGRISLLARVQLAQGWLIFAALAAQVIIFSVVPDAPRAVEIAMHIATYIAAGVAIWSNRRLPGLLILASGAFLNGLVITLNGGTLPASISAMRAAGRAVDKSTFQNSGFVGHPILPWFGDVFPTPSWLPFRNVLSVGDLLILAGMAVLVHSVSQSWLWRLCTRARAGRAARSGVGGDHLRSGEEEPLAAGDADLLESAQLRERLDALGNDGGVTRPGQVEEPGEGPPVHLVRVDVVNHGDVRFEDVGLQGQERL